MRRLMTVMIAAALLVAACGDDDTVEAGDPGTSTSTAADTTTSTTAPPDDGELPGEPIDIYPYADAQLAVVGVAADDVLNVRTRPGTGAAVAFTLDPLATDVTATGHNRALDEGGIWVEITTDDGTGWANVRYLAQLGTVTDVTADLYPVPADRPSAPTMDALATIVAATLASEEPPSTITIVDGPTDGDLVEAIVDVVGLGDDSIAGARLHLFAESSTDGVTLRTVEHTTLCLRGVTDDGLCT